MKERQRRCGYYSRETLATAPDVISSPEEEGSAERLEKLEIEKNSIDRSSDRSVGRSVTRLCRSSFPSSSPHEKEYAYTRKYEVRARDRLDSRKYLTSIEVYRLPSKIPPASDFRKYIFIERAGRRTRTFPRISSKEGGETRIFPRLAVYQRVARYWEIVCSWRENNPDIGCYKHRFATNLRENEIASKLLATKRNFLYGIFVSIVLREGDETISKRSKFRNCYYELYFPKWMDKRAIIFIENDKDRTDIEAVQYKVQITIYHGWHFAIENEIKTRFKANLDY